MSWFARLQDSQRKSPPILKRFDHRFNFQDWVAHNRQPVTLVRLREQFRFNDAGPISDRQELHRFAGGLMMSPLFDDQAAGGDCVTEEFPQTIEGTIRVPRDVVVQFQRVAISGACDMSFFMRRH